jgi:hypothetical protein
MSKSSWDLPISIDDSSSTSRGFANPLPTPSNLREGTSHGGPHKKELFLNSKMLSHQDLS